MPEDAESVSTLCQPASLSSKDTVIYFHWPGLNKHYRLYWKPGATSLWSTP